MSIFIIISRCQNCNNTFMAKFSQYTEYLYYCMSISFQMISLEQWRAAIAGLSPGRSSRKKGRLLLRVILAKLAYLRRGILKKKMLSDFVFLVHRWSMAMIEYAFCVSSALFIFLREWQTSFSTALLSLLSVAPKKYAPESMVSHA